MQEQTTAPKYRETVVPTAVMDYLDRLVDSRKRAYAADCIGSWGEGKPFASSWPNLKAEYVEDVARKLRRYGLKDSVKPVAAQTVKPKPIKAPRHIPAPSIVETADPVADFVEYLALSSDDSPGSVAAVDYLNARRIEVCLECAEAKSRKRKATRFAPWVATPATKAVIVAQQAERCIKCARSVEALGTYITVADKEAAEALRLEIDNAPVAVPVEAYAQAAG